MCHRFVTSIRTTPEALLRLIRQRWSIGNEWHWTRDAQLGEDAHRYANRTGAVMFSLLRTIAKNLLRLGGYRSIRHDLRELAYDIQGCWHWEGDNRRRNGLITLQATLPPGRIPAMEVGGIEVDIRLTA